MSVHNSKCEFMTLPQGNCTCPLFDGQQFDDSHVVEPSAMSEEQIARRDAMSKHTPGPWYVGERFDYHRVQVISADGLLICQTQGREQCEANARLIACAPDLKASVERLEREREEMRSLLQDVVTYYSRFSVSFHPNSRQILKRAEKLLAGG